MQIITVEHPAAEEAPQLVHVDESWLRHVEQTLDQLRPHFEAVLAAWVPLNLGPFPASTFGSLLEAPGQVIDGAVLTTARQHQLDQAGPFRIDDQQLLERLQVPGRPAFLAATEKLQRVLTNPHLLQVSRLFVVENQRLVIDQEKRAALERRAYTYAVESWEQTLWSHCQRIASELQAFDQIRFELEGHAPGPELKRLMNPIQMFVTLREHGRIKRQRAQRQEQELQTATA